MHQLTIFTPTYNRAYLLPKLYDSLCRQTSKDFVWSIVDDGSTDNTEEIVKQWQEQRKIDIIYHKQANGGKMRAHNYGVRLSDTELFLCIDSDDYLTDDAVEMVIARWNFTEKAETTCGIIAYRTIVKDGESRVLAPFPFLTDSNLTELYANGFKGDTTLIFKTDVIKQYPFPEIQGEKFITEAYIYDQIDQKYKYLLLSEGLTVCEYMEDGYTRNPTPLYENNPIGWTMYFNQKSQLCKSGLINRLKDTANYIAFGRYGKVKGLYANSTLKGLPYLLAYLLNYRYYRIYFGKR